MLGIFLMEKVGKWDLLANTRENNMKGYEKYEPKSVKVCHELLLLHEAHCIKGNVPNMTFILALQKTAYQLGISYIGSDKTPIILRDIITVFEGGD